MTWRLLKGLLLSIAVAALAGTVRDYKSLINDLDTSLFMALSFAVVFTLSLAVDLVVGIFKGEVL